MKLPLHDSPKIDEKTVQKAFFERFRSEYLALIPNTFLLGWEADILAISYDLIPSEFEIKLSVADFKNDAKKTKIVDADDEEVSPISFSTKYEAILSGKGASSLSYIIPNTLLSKIEIPEHFGIIVFEMIESQESSTISFLQIRSASKFHDNPISSENILRLISNLADHRFSESLKSSNEIIENEYGELKRKYHQLKRKFDAEMEAKDFVSNWNLEFDEELQSQIDILSEIIEKHKKSLSKDDLDRLSESGFFFF